MLKRYKQEILEPIEEMYIIPRNRRLKTLKSYLFCGSRQERHKQCGNRRQFDLSKHVLLPLYGLMCYVCMCNKAEHRHHVVPICRGGLNTSKNLVALCRHCHKKLDIPRNHPSLRSVVNRVYVPPRIKPKKKALSSYNAVHFVKKESSEG